MVKIVMQETDADAFDPNAVLPVDSLIRVRVEDLSVKDLDGKFGPWQKLDFQFAIQEVIHPDGYEQMKGRFVWGGVPFNFTDHPDNALKQWVEALFGLELKPGFELDTDNLVGRECKAVITHYPKKDGTEGMQVGSLIPLASAAPPAQEPAQEQVPEPQRDKVPF